MEVVKYDPYARCEKCVKNKFVGGKCTEEFNPPIDPGSCLFKPLNDNNFILVSCRSCTKKDVTPFKMYILPNVPIDVDAISSEDIVCKHCENTVNSSDKDRLLSFLRQKNSEIETKE